MRLCSRAPASMIITVGSQFSASHSVFLLAPNLVLELTGRKSARPSLLAVLNARGKFSLRILGTSCPPISPSFSTFDPRIQLLQSVQSLTPVQTSKVARIDTVFDVFFGV